MANASRNLERKIFPLSLSTSLNKIRKPLSKLPDYSAFFDFKNYETKAEKALYFKLVKPQISFLKTDAPKSKKRPYVVHQLKHLYNIKKLMNLAMAFWSPRLVSYSWLPLSVESYTREGWCGRLQIWNLLHKKLIFPMGHIHLTNFWII